MEPVLEPTPCPVCRAEDCRHVMSARDVWYRVPGTFRVVRCTSCGHVYLNPRPTQDTLAACYPADYGPHQHSAEIEPPRPTSEGSTNNESAKTRAPWYLSRPVRMIPGLRSLYYWLTDFRTEFIPEGAGLPGRGLDVGCARGDFLEKLRDAGWDAEGVEFMSAAAETARGRGFTVSEGTLEAADFPDAQFDAVFASMVLEHVPEPRQTLNEVRRVLRADGWFVFMVPNFGCWERFVFRGYWHGLDLPRHLQHFTATRLRRLLLDSGFDRIRVLHQRNMNNIVASAGLWLRERRGGKRIGQKLVDFAEQPGLWSQLLLALPARLLAALRQGGRLTIIARAAATPETTT